MLRGQHPEISSIYANDGTTLLARLRENQRSNIFLYFDFPDAGISNVVARLDTPLICVSEPFEDIVAYCMTRWHQDLPTAIRFVSRSIAGSFPSASSSSAMRLPFDKPISFAILADAIASHFGLAWDREKLIQLAATFEASTSEPVDEAIARLDTDAPGARALWLDLPETDRSVTTTIGRGYGDILFGRERPLLVWPGELFFQTGGETSNSGQAMELTGPARILSYGPYLHLPAGRWVAELRFQVDGNHSGNCIMMEVTSGPHILACGQGRLPESGILALKLPFEVNHPELPLEIRSVLPSGAIEGYFRLLEILVEPSTPDKNLRALAG